MNPTEKASSTSRRVGKRDVVAGKAIRNVFALLVRENICGFLLLLPAAAVHGLFSARSDYLWESAHLARC